MTGILDTICKLDAPMLGQMLDDVEREFGEADAEGLTMTEGMADICSRHFHIRSVYFGTVRAPLLDRVATLERDEQRVTLERTLSRWSASVQKHENAKQRLEEMNAAGPDFYGAREHCDAEAAEEHTEAIAEVYWRRLREQRRIHEIIATARNAGERIKRTLLSPTGYVKTGKYLWKDGVKVPVVRKQS
jgi:hypothetical protein